MTGPAARRTRRRATILLAALALAAGCAPSPAPRSTHPVAASPRVEPTREVAAPQMRPVTPGKIVYVKAGRLFDGVSDALRTNIVVVLEGERIQRVAPAADVAIPEGASVVDLSGAVVLPGLIDCHVHLASRGDRFDELAQLKESPFFEAFAAVVNARKTLLAGFTTVRDLGSVAFLAVDLRRSIDEGFLVGPRVVASGPAISITGGHSDMNGFAPQLRYGWFPEERGFGIADGVEQVRHVVRAQMKYGVDVIKLAASGGVFSRGDQPGSPQFTVDELRAAVEEAHATGRKVAAHAHGTQGIKNAVTAGVDSIEHGSFLDDESIRMMKQKGTWLVADVYNDDYILASAVELKIPEEFVEKERALGKTQRESFARAVRAGVRIAFGTDAGIYPHGGNAKQFAHMVRLGLTPAAAIRAATSSAAELLGRSDVGALVAGRYADLVAVPDDPLADVRSLERVRFVMKGGRVVRDELSPARSSAP